MDTDCTRDTTAVQTWKQVPIQQIQIKSRASAWKKISTEADALKKTTLVVKILETPKSCAQYRISHLQAVEPVSRA